MRSPVNLTGLTNAASGLEREVTGFHFGEAGLGKKATGTFANVTRDDPPRIIFVGTEDNVLPIPMLKSFLEKYKTTGVRMDAVIYDGEGHSFFSIRRSLDRFYDTTIETDKFLASLGWVQGPPTLTREWVQKLAVRARS